MDAAKTEKLNNCIDSFANELHCYLCNNLYKSPYTATQCGHIYCHECIQKYLKAGKTECPQCGVQIPGKSLTRNSSYSTMVQCITKIRNLINGIPLTQQPMTAKDQAEVLKDVLDGIVGSDETDLENAEIENKEVDNKAAKETVAKKVATKKADTVKSSEKVDITDIKKAIAKKLTVKKAEVQNVTVKKADEPLKVKKAEVTTKKEVKKEISAIKDVAVKKEVKKDVAVKKSKSFGLLLTGLSEDQKKIVSSNLQNLSKISGEKSITFKVVQDYCPETVSHIICACAPKSRCPRTLKYLLGIAGKAWIVSFQWLLDSIAAREILDERDFVVVGDEAVQVDTHACEKSRADEGKLFEGKRFYLAGSFNAPGPSKTDLANLIHVAGGTVVKKQDEGVVVISNNSNGPKDGEKPYTWLFDAVSLYQI